MQTLAVIRLSHFIGLILRPTSRVMRTVSWISLLLLIVYLLNTLFLYLYDY